MRVYIKDCNGDIIGNPKGYRTMRGAHREAMYRHWDAINAKYDAKHAGEVNPQGEHTLFTVTSRDE